MPDHSEPADVREKSKAPPETTDLGQNDAKITDMIGNVAEKVVDSISHKLHPLVERYAKMFKSGARTPILRRPSDYGMRYDDVFFPSADGVPLDAWFIPADSDRLLIVNHPMTCNRYGFPGHLPPWNTMFGGFEVNFLPELKHLHNAGYNILTYDLRNCGLSGMGTAVSAAWACSNVAMCSAPSATPRAERTSRA